MKTESMKTLAVSLKGMFTKVAIAGALAGTVLFAAPKQADAQGFSVQFGIGHPYARPLLRSRLRAPGLRPRLLRRAPS